MPLARALQPAGLALTFSLLVVLLANALVSPALAVVLGLIASRVEVSKSLVLSAMLLPLAFFAGVLALSSTD